MLSSTITSRLFLDRVMAFVVHMIPKTIVMLHRGCSFSCPDSENRFFSRLLCNAHDVILLSRFSFTAALAFAFISHVYNIIITLSRKLKPQSPWEPFESHTAQEVDYVILKWDESYKSEQMFYIAKVSSILQKIKTTSFGKNVSNKSYTLIWAQ